MKQHYYLDFQNIDIETMQTTFEQFEVENTKIAKSPLKNVVG